ncbi:hypothetical protein [Mesorhizobium sp. WSM3224]|jgi:hypothetical protein|uniref:hypothetical protein n=1 Tax=Mesorhizobium sp. WSM3224 TaxID=1040986 RepID=UPI0012EB46C7|nr:hypothetical protein [Mesorhizobium sp. WSM3224]
MIEAVVSWSADKMTTIRAWRLGKTSRPVTKKMKARPHITKIAAKVFAIISPSCIVPLSQVIPAVRVNTASHDTLEQGILFRSHSANEAYLPFKKEFRCRLE